MSRFVNQIVLPLLGVLGLLLFALGLTDRVSGPSLLIAASILLGAATISYAIRGSAPTPPR